MKPIATSISLGRNGLLTRYRLRGSGLRYVLEIAGGARRRLRALGGWLRCRSVYTLQFRFRPSCWATGLFGYSFQQAIDYQRLVAE